MSTTTTHIYEGLFLLPQSAGTDLGASAELIKSILAKVGAEIISFRKWDERRLAYEIKGNKRGLYFLCYFRLAGTEMAALDRQCVLSEGLLRQMFTRADHLTIEEMQASDGQQELADEIKLRSEQGSDRSATGTSISQREDAVDDEIPTAAEPTDQESEPVEVSSPTPAETPAAGDPA